MTQKLFYENLYMTEFDATVIETEEKDGKTHILLDRTAFYPGGGGQPCDTGFLNGHPVEAAYEKNGDISSTNVIFWPTIFSMLLMESFLMQRSMAVLIGLVALN